jgi:hypothetical protein
MLVMRLENGIEIKIVFLETGKPDSTQNKRQKDHKKLIRFCKDSIDMTATSKDGQWSYSVLLSPT